MKERERLDRPITGICSFAKYPICNNLEDLDADIAVMGVPDDNGIGYLSGSRLGPRRIREVSTHYARGEAGFYDPEKDEQVLAYPIRIVDCGDADVLHGDIEYTHESVEYMVRKILEKGAIPAIMGGDHSITIPNGRALKYFDETINIIQIDAHLDWTDSVGPQRYGNGSPMRRLSEMDHIGKMFQIGLRGLGSSRREDFEAAREYGSKLITAREIHDKGVEFALDKIPEGGKYFLSIDIDGYDMSIAPGVGSPSPGGLYYNQVQDLVDGICQKVDVIGFDLVEVAPQYDPTNITCRLAAMTMLNTMSAIMKNK